MEITQSFIVTPTKKVNILEKPEDGAQVIQVANQKISFVVISETEEWYHFFNGWARKENFTRS